MNSFCLQFGEFHCAILTEETRISEETRKILFYQLSRQRQFTPIFCTQIPLKMARKPYRTGVLLTGENVRSCAAPILKVYRRGVNRLSYDTRSLFISTRKSILCIVDVPLAWLAQLGERRSAEREATGSKPSQTNTQGL